MPKAHSKNAPQAIQEDAFKDRSSTPSLSTRDDWPFKRLTMGWALWVLAALFYALDYFQHTAPSVLMGPISHSLGISVTEVGVMMSLYFPVYALVQIPGGMLLDRYPLRYVLSGACVIVTVGLWMMTLGHVSGVVMGRILIAIGSSCAFLGALKTAATWLPMSWFPVAVGLTNTLGVAGGILGQAYLNHLITHQGWRGALSEIVYAGCVLSVALWLFLRGPARVSSAVAFETGSQATPRCQPYGLGKSLRSCLLNPKAWAIALYAGIMVGVVVNAFSELYDVVFLEKAFGVTSQSAAWISSMVFLGIAVGGPLHGVLAGYFGRSRWIQWACVATLVCFVMVIVVMGVGRTFPIQGLFVLYFLVGFFVSSMLLSFPMMSDLFSAEHQAMGFGFLNMLIAFSGFVFQSGLGWMLHVSGVGTGVLTLSSMFHSLLYLMLPLIIGLGLLHWAVKNR